MYNHMLINRYVIKVVDRKVLKHAKPGDIICDDTTNEHETTVVGFIGNVFKETKSLEICLFKPVSIKNLKVPKKRILYYESDYDVQARFREMKKQGII